jgi:hypothetical protein
MTSAPLAAFLAAEKILFVKVQKPVFDLVGVVLYSLGLAGICAIVALVLGSAFGIVLIVRNRRLERAGGRSDGFQLLEPHRS